MRMFRSIHVLVYAVGILLTFLATATTAHASNTGLATLGLPRMGEEDVKATSDLLVQAGGNVEVSMLWEFNPSNPFGNASRLIQGFRDSQQSVIDLLRLEERLQEEEDAETTITVAPGQIITIQ